MEAIATKKCFKCDAALPLAEFYAHPQMFDGRVNKCKPCNRKDVQDNYAKRRKQYSAYDQARRQLPERKAAQLEYARQRKARDPQRDYARNAVGNAIRDGRLVRQPCEVCGDTNVQGHHDDYSRALDVRWLCFKHHREHHGQIVTVEV